MSVNEITPKHSSVREKRHLGNSCRINSSKLYRDPHSSFVTKQLLLVFLCRDLKIENFLLDEHNNIKIVGMLASLASGTSH